MHTVNSLSGGKTSSYMAIHYPADIEIFSLVCIDCHNAAGTLKKDRKLIQRINDKLEHYIPQYGDFVATAEDPKTVKVMFDLEQKIGREIKWVRGPSFEKMMDKKSAVPNRQWRFCTYELKIKPIFEYLFMNTSLPVEMRCGYRFDELERKESFTNLTKFSNICEVKSNGKWQHRWQELEWRKGSFPLIEDHITHLHIQSFWKTEKIEFPEDSNCQFCFWKQVQQLRKNFDTNLAIMQWASIQEILRDRTFKKENTLEQSKKVGLQLDFKFGTGSGCQAGFCTD